MFIACRVRHQYVDVFIAGVPTANREKFKKLAETAAVIFKEGGALSVAECWGDDVPDGKVTSFPMAVKLKEDETVVFSWITYKSRAHRDKVNAKVMKDPRLASMCDPKDMPFDCKRMLYGGFSVIVSA